MKKLTTYTYADVSTQHITKADNDLLVDDAVYSAVGNSQSPTLVVFGYDGGFFVQVPQDDREYFDEAMQVADAAGYSPALVALLRQAFDLGCQFLRLDADGDTVEDAPTFDWDEGAKTEEA